MTTIDTILKPFKFVENEVESVVAKVYDVYHDKTGGDQYGLSNFYILNATIFGAAARYSESASAIETVEEAAIITAVSAIHYFNNNQNRKYDKELSNLEQLAKHPQREASTPTSQFRVDREQTVSDKKTNLMWQRCLHGQRYNNGHCQGDAETLTWQESLDSTKTVEHAGYTDWRLPSREEIVSIVEKRCKMPAINLTAFPDTPSGWQWTSSYIGFHPALHNTAWAITFRAGNVNKYMKIRKLPIRLVRTIAIKH